MKFFHRRAMIGDRYHNPDYIRVWRPKPVMARLRCSRGWSMSVRLTPLAVAFRFILIESVADQL